MKKAPLFILYITALLLSSSTTLFAQKRKVQNLPNYDKKQKLHFGFLLGLNSTDFIVTRIGTFNQLDTLYTLEPQKQSGFNLGIVTSLRLAENFDLRFVPDLAFSQRNIDYTFYVNGIKKETVTKKIESTFLEFPIDLKFKSNRVNNFRAYALGGLRYCIDMVSQAKVEEKDKELVRLIKNDYGYEIGVGVDFYMELFKLSFEIKMYHGLPNLLVKDNLIYNSSLDALYSKIFNFSMTFE